MYFGQAIDEELSVRLVNPLRLIGCKYLLRFRSQSLSLLLTNDVAVTY